MNKKWKPITAGIISILFGVVAFPPALFIPFIVGITFYSHFYFPHAVSGGGIVILTGVVAIIGGINAVRRKRFHLALTGSVASCVAFTLAILFMFYNGNIHETFIALPVMGIVIIAAVAIARNRKLAIIALIALVIANSSVGYYFFIYKWIGYDYHIPIRLEPLMALSAIGLIPIVLTLLSRKEFE